MTERCVFCGSEIRFRVIRGHTVPLHAGKHDCVGRQLYQRELEDVCHPTSCPKCSVRVYFVRHNGGSVWFDDLGQPWPKHGCFDTAPSAIIPLPPSWTAASYRIARVLWAARLAWEPGFAICVACPNEPNLQLRVPCDPTQHDLTKLKGKDIFYAKPLHRFQTFSGESFSFTAHIPKFYRDREEWYFTDFGSICPLCNKTFPDDRPEHMRVCSEYVWLRPYEDDDDETENDDHDA